jgi:Family of unknown function (DUF6526)
MRAPQNFSNHAKIVPAFHFVVVPVLFLNLIWCVIFGIKLLGNSSFGLVSRIGGAMLILDAIALVVLAFLARLFALGVQDRVIRMEERLRFRQVLPEDLKTRSNEFTINQLVSLRFASDAELPELARKVLEERLNSRKAIKQMIQNWRADYQRI